MDSELLITPTTLNVQATLATGSSVLSRTALQLDGVKARLMTEELRAIDAEARADELEEQLDAERSDAQVAQDAAAQLQAELEVSRGREMAGVGNLCQMQQQVRKLL